MPQSIEFFRTIGASKFILDTLTYGHHPKLTGPVPDYEIENTIMDLIAEGRVEIFSKKPKLANPLHVVV